MPLSIINVSLKSTIFHEIWSQFILGKQRDLGYLTISIFTIGSNLAFEVRYSQFLTVEISTQTPSFLVPRPSARLHGRVFVLMAPLEFALAGFFFLHELIILVGLSMWTAPL